MISSACSICGYLAYLGVADTIGELAAAAFASSFAVNSKRLERRTEVRQQTGQLLSAPSERRAMPDGLSAFYARKFVLM